MSIRPAGVGLGCAVLAGAIAGGALGCAVTSSRTLELGRGPVGMPARCQDGRAPRVLADPACAAGGCGWSCLPHRDENGAPAGQAAPGGAIGARGGRE